jgi:fructose-1,6-bisphosphatase II / sedoheptulose-1,7-bisphosphatase
MKGPKKLHVSRRQLIATALASAAVPQVAFANTPIEIAWDDLIPQGVPYSEIIGEGEMDEAPMLFIGEKLGTGNGEPLDIAVDPLDGTTLTAKNLPDAISVIAVAEKGNLLQAPDTYMEKIAIGPDYPENIIDLDNSIETNLNNMAEFKSIKPSELTVCLLERDRHKKIVESINKISAKIKFISDGDVMGAIYTCIKDFNVGFLNK